MASRSYPLSLSPQNENRGTDDLTRSKGVHSVTQRLQKELMSLMMTPEKTVSAFPEGENLFNWVATIAGPVNTVYDGYTYKLAFEFPKNYPYAPPAVTFSNKCYHPNVDTVGNICLDILKDKWSASYDVRAILLSIQSLLGDPNILSPLNVDAAEKWANEEEYKKALVAFQK